MSTIAPDTMTTETPAPETAAEERVPPICALCKHWVPDVLFNEKRAVWGNCIYGLPERMTMANRMTPDMGQCSAWEHKN